VAKTCLVCSAERMSIHSKHGISASPAASSATTLRRTQPSATRVLATVHTLEGKDGCCVMTAAHAVQQIHRVLPVSQTSNTRWAGPTRNPRDSPGLNPIRVGVVYLQHVVSSAMPFTEVGQMPVFSRTPRTEVPMASHQSWGDCSAQPGCVHRPGSLARATSTTSRQ
jgi:hypothetical protein